MKKYVYLTTLFPFLFLTVYTVLNYDIIFLCLLALFSILCIPFLQSSLLLEYKKMPYYFDLSFVIWNFLSMIFLALSLIYKKYKVMFLICFFLPYLIFNVIYYSKKGRGKKNAISKRIPLFISLLFPFCYLFLNGNTLYLIILNLVFSMILLIGLFPFFGEKKVPTIYYGILLLVSVLAFQPVGCIYSSCLYYRSLVE